ncbi:DUF4097 domain-containing protein [bacterium]|nr:DUF4097 domain-containing protein [bacterium]
MKKDITFMFVLVSLILNAVHAQSKSFSTEGLKELHVNNLSGDLVITAGKVSELAVDYEKLKFSEHCQLTMEKKSERLVIEVKKIKKRWRDGCKVKFNIQVPKKLDLKLNVGSGNIRADGVHGEAKINVGSGDLNYTSSWIDELDVQSGSGDIEVKGISGQAKLMTGSGEIKLDYAEHAVPEMLTVRSGSGSIQATGLKSSVDIITGSGSVDLSFNQRMQNKGEVSIKSGSGDAHVHFPKNVSEINIDHKAASGRVKTNIAQKTTAAWTIYMRSASGDLNITQ